MTKSNLYTLFTCIVVAICFFLFNYFVPYYDDDVWYALRYVPGETLSPISNFSDILVSQYHHYIGENSRALIHITLQSLLAVLPDYAFDIVNTLIFMLLIWCMALYTQGSKESPRPITLLMIVAGIYWLMPDMDYLFYWASGSLNYMWTSAATLSFMLMWQHVTQHNKPISATSIGLAVWAFCCGFGHEALSLPVGATVFMYMLIHYRSIGVNQKTLIAVAYGLGCIAILAAPGLENKARHIEYISVQQFLSSVILTLRNLRVIPLCLLIAVLSLFCKSWRAQAQQFIKVNFNLILTTIIAFFFVVAISSGVNTMRIFYGAEFFALLLLLRAINRVTLTLSPRIIRALSTTMATSLTIWVIAIMPCAYQTGLQHKAIFKQSRNDKNEVIFLEYENKPQIAQRWVMDLHKIYYEAPEAEWRGFVIPLVGLKDTLAIPTPLIARNSDMSYKLYGRYIQILPWGVKEAIELPEAFFTSANKVVGNNPFYITPDSRYVITPLENLPTHSHWQWQYKPASWRDPSASFLGRIKRVVAPHTIPTTAPMQFPDTVALPDGRKYVIYIRPPYNTLQGIEKVE